MFLSVNIKLPKLKPRQSKYPQRLNRRAQPAGDNSKQEGWMPSRAGFLGFCQIALSSAPEGKGLQNPQFHHSYYHQDKVRTKRGNSRNDTVGVAFTDQRKVGFIKLKPTENRGNCLLIRCEITWTITTKLRLSDDYKITFKTITSYSTLVITCFYCRSSNK